MQTNNCSRRSLSSRIWPCRCEPSLKMMPAATTGRLIPQARPRAALLSTKQQGMFFSSHCAGSVMITSSGSQSAARITASTSLLVIDFSSSLAPFRTCRRGSNCWISSRIFLVNLWSAMGQGLRMRSVTTGFFSCCFSACPRMSMNSSSFSSISFNYQLSEPSVLYRMTSISLYDELVKDIDTALLASERESRQSLRVTACDQFEQLVRQVRGLQESVAANNRGILQLKDSLISNAKKEKEKEICAQLKKSCDHNYQLITEMREKLVAANSIVEQQRAASPNEPETFSKIYRKQHLAQQVDAILKESFVIQKLVERFSFETTLKRIRFVLPEVSEEEAHKIAKQKDGLSQAMSLKVIGKAANNLKNAHSDYLDKAEGVAQLQASIEQNLKLMKEVSLLVFRQGEMINDVLKNVEKAKDYVRKGEAVLEIEKDKHKKSRKKMCCIIFLGLLIIAIIATPIIITQIKKANADTTTTDTTDTTDTVNSTLLLTSYPPAQQNELFPDDDFSSTK